MHASLPQWAVWYERHVIHNHNCSKPTRISLIRKIRKTDETWNKLIYDAIHGSRNANLSLQHLGAGAQGNMQIALSWGCAWLKSQNLGLTDSLCTGYTLEILIARHITASVLAIGNIKFWHCQEPKAANACVLIWLFIMMLTYLIADVNHGAHGYPQLTPCQTCKPQFRNTLRVCIP